MHGQTQIKSATYFNQFVENSVISITCTGRDVLNEMKSENSHTSIN